MAQGAKVLSVSDLAAFRAALIEFADEARMALSSAQSESARTLSWLRLEQAPRWESERARRQELLARARSELVQRQAMADMDRRPDVDLKKSVDRAARALQDAERMADATRRWATTIDRESAIFEGRCQSLAALVEGDIPRAVAYIDGLVQSLDAYLRTIAPDAPPLDPAEPRP